MFCFMYISFISIISIYRRTPITSANSEVVRNSNLFRNNQIIYKNEAFRHHKKYS